MPADPQPEMSLVEELARLVAAGPVSPRLTDHWHAHGAGDLGMFIDRSYWELGFGRLEAPGPRVMSVGINPSEDALLAGPEQPWGVLPIAERIERWRACDAWTLGEADRASFERLNPGLAFGTKNTWAYFRRLRELFRAAGREGLLRGSYCTNAGKFTSPTVKDAGPEFRQEIVACLPVLARQLRLVRPTVIVAIGKDDVVPALVALFQGEGGALALDEVPVVNEKGQRRYYASGWGNMDGERVLVVAVPHTSGNAHFNFDPFRRELAARLADDLAAAGL